MKYLVVICIAVLFQIIPLISMFGQNDAIGQGIPLDSVKGGYKSVKSILSDLDDSTNKEKVRAIAVIKYNEKGYKIESLEYNEKYILLNTRIYKYDDYGRIIRFSEYQTGAKDTIKHFYKYNTKGKIIEEIHKNNDTINYKLIYNYDKNDNLIEWYEIDNFGKQGYKIIYSYDKLNNPIKKIEYYKSKIQTIQEIIYSK